MKVVFKNLLAVFAMALGLTIHTQADPPSPEYKLVWSDEFDGTQLDLKKWKPRPFGERKGGINDPACAALDGQGHLVITVRDVDGKAHAAILSTEGIFSPTFGYFECRAKMQKQVGWQSAFWLQAPHMADPDRGTATPDDTAHNGTEIDIFEYLAREDNLIHHCLHWNGYGKLHKRSPSTLKVPGLSEGFHTFGVEWRADGYTFFVDGKKTYETKDAPSATPQYILVSGEVGPWGGDITKAKLPDAVMFDYVRVYQKPAKP